MPEPSPKLAFSVIQNTYIALLRLPFDSERVNLQQQLCDLRDYLAIAENRTVEKTQNYYEWLVQE